MSEHLHHSRPLFALLATVVCIAAIAVNGAPALAAGTGSTGGSIAPTGSGAGAGGSTTNGSQAGTGAKPSSSSQTSGSGASKAGRTATVHANIATWYGPGFYGNKTACGQTLTPTLVGVANRTLPCGTLVKVSYGGRSEIVPVLDRGPYAHNGANWDLTAGAATALDITEKVRIGAIVVGSVPNSLSLGSPSVAPGETPGETAFGGSQPS